MPGDGESTSCLPAQFDSKFDNALRRVIGRGDDPEVASPNLSAGKAKLEEC
jgi:hypothetical protein